MSAFGYFPLAGSLRPISGVIGIKEHLSTSPWEGLNEPSGIQNWKKDRVADYMGRISMATNWI